MNFDQSFDALISHEGGFTENPNDPGNWTGGEVGKGKLLGTKYGIAANTYPLEDIPNLTLDRAKELYKRDFWNKLCLERLPECVRFDLFDAAVNSGVSRAAKILQQAAGTVPDGSIGPATVAAANALPPEKLDKRISGQRLLYLCGLRAWSNFGNGWVRRVANNLIND